MAYSVITMGQNTNKKYMKIFINNWQKTIDTRCNTM